MQVIKGIVQTLPQQIQGKIKPTVASSGEEYQKGYDTGYTDGYDEGKNSGEEQGYDRGYDKGYTAGREFLKYANSLYGTFAYAEFPEGYEITLELPTIESLYTAFRGSTGIRKVTLKGNDNKNVLNVGHLFRQSTVEEVDITDFNFIVGDGTNAFGDAPNLKRIIGVVDCSQATTLAGMFSYDSYLEEFYPLANTIKLSINFSYCLNLIPECRQAIIDGLAVVETAQTLTLHKDLKILQSQVDSANAKGWTVAGGTIVSEEEYYG